MEHTHGLAVDVMTIVNAQQSPTVSFKQFCELLAGHRFHTAISTIRSFVSGLAGEMSTDRRPSTAS